MQALLVEMVVPNFSTDGPTLGLEYYMRVYGRLFELLGTAQANYDSPDDSRIAELEAILKLTRAWYRLTEFTGMPRARIGRITTQTRRSHRPAAPYSTRAPSAPAQHNMRRERYISGWGSRACKVAGGLAGRV